jgi:hypothetical protein
LSPIAADPAAAGRAGNPAGGAGLLDEAQRRIVDYYRLSWIPSVKPFVRAGARGSRERLWVRQLADQLELALELPAPALALPVAALDQPSGGALDGLCQVVEGVSHFVLLADRARRERPTTELELELQAELDKYLLLVVAPVATRRRVERSALRRRLFHGARFAHRSGTVQGERYRLANRLALRLTRRFERRYLSDGRHADLRAELRRLYRVGQSDKLALAHAG